MSIWLNQGGTRFSDELVIDLTDPAIARGVAIPADADGLEAVDLVGDGVRGILWSFRRAGTEPNYWFLPLCRGAKPGLLTQVDTGTGGRVDIGWSTTVAEAAAAEAAGRAWEHHAPFPASVVKSVRRVDRITGVVETTEFGYRNAHHDRADRRFLGFEEVTETAVGVLDQAVVDVRRRLGA